MESQHTPTHTLTSYLSPHINCHNILEDAFSSLMHKKFKSRFRANFAQRAGVSHTGPTNRIWALREVRQNISHFTFNAYPRHFSLFFLSFPGLLFFSLCVFVFVFARGGVRSSQPKMLHYPHLVFFFCAVCILRDPFFVCVACETVSYPALGQLSS